MFTQIRRLAAPALVGLAVVGGTNLVAAPSAHAATSVSACFRWSTGAAYASQPIHLQRWDGRNWTGTGRSGRTNSYGCGTFSSTNSSQYLTIKAYVVLNYGSHSEIWAGYPPNYANPGQGGVSLGTGTVRYVTRF